MDQIPTLQQLEYLETGFEVSKILAQAGFAMEKAALSITWGQIAEEIAHVLADYGLPPDRLREDFLIDLARGVQKVLQNEQALPWRRSIRALTVEHPTFQSFMATGESDEGETLFSEQYENATRLGDDEAYWVDGGASADLFDEL
jgi:hypothetical protein